MPRTTVCSASSPFAPNRRAVCAPRGRGGGIKPARRAARSALPRPCWRLSGYGRPRPSLVWESIARRHPCEGAGTSPRDADLSIVATRCLSRQAPWPAPIAISASGPGADSTGAAPRRMKLAKGRRAGDPLATRSCSLNELEWQSLRGRIRGLARDGRLLGRSAHRSVPVAHGRRWPCPSASMATESAARCATFGGLTPGCGKHSRRARPQPARNLARRAWQVACPHGHSRRPSVDGSKQEVPMPVAAANRYRRQLPRLYWEGKGNALGSRRQPAASREPVP